MNADFIARILEGFEGTLDEVIGRVASPGLKADLEILQTQINSLRLTIDPPEPNETAVRGAVTMRRERR